MKFTKTAEQLRKLLELRRSNAASAVPSKKKYSRKQKHKGHNEDEN